jgi:hypothetical protein
MRLRAAQGRLKVEHSIIGGVRELLERLLADSPEVRSVVPGVIRKVRDARGLVRIRVTVATVNGWKAIALSSGARQELFISTPLTKPQLEFAFARAQERAGV